MDSVNPGTVAYRAMEARFASGPVRHYSTDFTVHDRRVVTSFMVPGMRALWHLRSTGTALAFIGIKDERLWLDTVLKLQAPEQCELLLVTCQAHATVVERVSEERARALAGSRPLLDFAVSGPRFGPRLVFFKRGDQRVAEGRFEVRRERDSATLVVDAALDFKGGPPDLYKMVARLQLEEAIASTVQTLFWRFAELRVHGLPDSDWLRSLGKSLIREQQPC